MTDYKPLGRAVGVLETKMLRRLPGFDGMVWIAKPVRLLVLDPRDATPADWLVWEGLRPELAAPVAEVPA